jgi:glycosidase
MATDKYYGTEAKLKEFVDVCHQNGIAVILDIAFNHAFGRNPMIRMYMNDADGDGWGGPATDNPFFNTIAKHSYSVGDDFNHSSSNTKEYVKRTLKHWITEFKVDGFRWDLTKGFTQNCQGSDACTNSYQQDRVDVLKDYADAQWLTDPTQYVIFEHLGSDTEEQQWANYRLNEGKGIMMWGEMFAQYKTLAQGFTSNDIGRISHTSRGFTGKRLMGYSESHDKDRLMYEAIKFGDVTGTSPVRNNVTNAVNKMAAIGAISVLIPGPKMIWHFQELGMDDSIWTCTNGTINSDYDGNVPAGDCKLATKLQPQWTNNYLTTAPRSTVYADYSKFTKLKKNEPVFNGDFSISPNGSNTKQRIYIFDNNIPATSLKNVVILANMATSAQDITPDFPYVGTWVNLMDNSTINVTNTASPINIPAGGYRIYGNQPAQALNAEAFSFANNLNLYPNPSKNSFSINTDAQKIEVYSITGQVVANFSNINANSALNIDALQSGIY